MDMILYHSLSTPVSAISNPMVIINAGKTQQTNFFLGDGQPENKNPNPKQM